MNTWILNFDKQNYQLFAWDKLKYFILNLVKCHVLFC